MLANLLSGYGAIDIVLGSLTTLVASACTYLIGRALKEGIVSFLLGGIPPVILNAIVIPFVIILASPDGGMATYWVFFFHDDISCFSKIRICGWFSTGIYYTPKENKVKSQSV
jgi:hypothetical protein